MRWAGILGILVILVSIAGPIIDGAQQFSSFSTTTPEETIQNANAISETYVITQIIASILSIGFMFGFVVLGKRYNNKLMIVTAYIFLLFGVITIIGNTYTFINLNEINVSIQESLSDLSQGTDGIEALLAAQASKTPLIGSFYNIIGFEAYLIVIGVLVVGALVLRASFGASFYKLQNVKYNKAIGAFEMIGSVLGFLLFIAMILEIIMFFSESKKQGLTQGSMVMQQTATPQQK